MIALFNRLDGWRGLPTIFCWTWWWIYKDGSRSWQILAHWGGSKSDFNMFIPAKRLMFLLWLILLFGLCMSVWQLLT